MKRCTSKEAVEDLENYLKTAPPTKRPQAYSSEQILIAINQLFTRAMTEADDNYDRACNYSYSHSREIRDKTYEKFTNYRTIVDTLNLYKKR